MPMRMANTGPPTTSNRWPSSQAGTAITRQIRMPSAFFLTNSIIRFLSLLTIGVVSYHAVQDLSKKSGAASGRPDDAMPGSVEGDLRLSPQQIVRLRQIHRPGEEAALLHPAAAALAEAAGNLHLRPIFQNQQQFCVGDCYI